MAQQKSILSVGGGGQWEFELENIITYKIDMQCSSVRFTNEKVSDPNSQKSQKWTSNSSAVSIRPNQVNIKISTTDKKGEDIQRFSQTRDLEMVDVVSDQTYANSRMT